MEQVNRNTDSLNEQDEDEEFLAAERNIENTGIEQGVEGLIPERLDDVTTIPEMESSPETHRYETRELTSSHKYT